MELLHQLQADPVLRGLAVLGVLALLALLHAWGAFKTTYSAEKWALRGDRPKALKAAAWMAGLPLRLAFSLFNGLVAALVWALLGFFAYAVWRIVTGA